MHDHDHELIGDLADGALGPEEAQRAEVEIAACDECRADLAAQQAALAALAEAPRPGLTALESAQLRRSVAEAAGLASETSQQRRRFLPWAGVATAAAVLVAIVIAAPLVDSLSTGSDDDAADIAAAETTLAKAGAGEPLAESDAAADAEGPTEAASESTETAVEDPQAPEPEEAAGEDLAQAADEAAGGLLVLGTVTLEDLEALRDTFPEQAGLAGGLEFRAVGPDEAPFLEFGRVTPSPGTAGSLTTDTCSSEILAAIPNATLVVATATAEFEGSPVLIVAVFNPEVAPPRIVIVNETGCRIVATVGE